MHQVEAYICIWRFWDGQGSVPDWSCGPYWPSFEVHRASSTFTYVLFKSVTS